MNSITMRSDVAASSCLWGSMLGPPARARRTPSAPQLVWREGGSEGLHSRSLGYAGLRPSHFYYAGRHTSRQLKMLPCRSSQGDLDIPSSKEELIVWVQTTNQDVLTAALESGISTFLFPRELLDLADSWSRLGRLACVFSNGDTLLDSRMEVIGSICLVANGRDLKSAESECERSGYVLMDAMDWQIIPAENLVAAFQGKPGILLAAAKSASDARVMLEALETGTHGVVLRTEDPAEVRKLMEYVRDRRDGNLEELKFEAAKVVRVDAVGMGDRVCVDLCTLMEPGSGLLVGSFARTLFLVQAECSETLYINSRPFRVNAGPPKCSKTLYINSRPFRVNAGPVHSYVAVPGGRTAYLAELHSGSEVLVADAKGRTQTALVGRCKIERRPLVLVEVETSDGQRHSLLLQNAETVKLVGPQRDSYMQGATSSSQALPPSLAQGPGGNGASALVLSPEHALAQQAALAARSWVMNSHESSLEIDDDDDSDEEEKRAEVAGEGERVGEGTAGEQGTSLPPPQRMTRQVTGVLKWVLEPAQEQAEQERGSAALSSTPPVGTSQARAAAAGAAWVLDVSADPPSSGQLGARGGPDAGGPSEVGGSGRRMLSRANSRVLQWVMRDEGNALASEDLMETLDVEDMNRDGGKEASLLNTTGATIGPFDGQTQRQRNDGSGSGSERSAASIAVSELQVGQQVYVMRQGGARHTGISLTGIRVLER